MTQIGVSISITGAKCQIYCRAHRDGIIVEVGPARGPKQIKSQCETLERLLHQFLCESVVGNIVPEVCVP